MADFSIFSPLLLMEFKQFLEGVPSRTPKDAEERAAVAALVQEQDQLAETFVCIHRTTIAGWCKIPPGSEALDSFSMEANWLTPSTHPWTAKWLPSGLIWTHLDSSGLIWTHLDSSGLWENQTLPGIWFPLQTPSADRLFRQKAESERALKRQVARRAQ